MAERYKDDGLVVLAVNAWGEDRETIKRFVDENKLTHRIVIDSDGSVWGGSYPAWIPGTFWIDRAGIIRDIELGFHGPKPLEQKTKRLLARG